MKLFECEFRFFQWFINIFRIKGKSFIGGLKGLFYFIICFFASKEEYEKGEYIFLPGTLMVPRNLKKFRKYSKLRVSRVDTRDIDELHKIIHGKVISYSYGARVMGRYIEKYGWSKITKLYVIAHPHITKRPNHPKITYIYGDRDFVAAAFEFDIGKLKELHTVYGGHTFFFSDKETIKQVGEIIKKY